MRSVRGYEGFSRQHRERLVMGSGPSQTTTSSIRRNRAKASITVVVRKRPLTVDEIERGEHDILVLFPHNNGIRVDEPRKNVIGVPYTEPHEFVFDRAYGEYHTNRDVYSTCVRHLVDSVFQEGSKCACFAYGQTGSGKTYTMIGRGKMKGLNATSTKDLDDADVKDAGLLELAAQDCFRWLRTREFESQYGLHVSFYEIYCNKVYDLLNRRSYGYPIRHLVRALETNSTGNVVVKDLKQVKVDDVATIIRVINSGLEHRIMGMNSKNNDSSRGHAILTLEVKDTQQGKTSGKLVFVDLAGSERGIDAMGSGKQTQTDGAGINRSLLALKECIRALDLQSSHVPFRDSELTKVLRDMFVGSNTRTLMISCVSPSDACCEQTLNTLRYADRVKAMRRNGNTSISDIEETDPHSTSCRERSTVLGQDVRHECFTPSGPLHPGVVQTPKFKTVQRRTIANSVSGLASVSTRTAQTPRWTRVDTVVGNAALSRSLNGVSPLKSYREHLNGSLRPKYTTARETPGIFKQDSAKEYTHPQPSSSPKLSLSSSCSSFTSCSTSGKKSPAHGCGLSKSTSSRGYITSCIRKSGQRPADITSFSSGTRRMSKPSGVVVKPTSSFDTKSNTLVWCESRKTTEHQPKAFPKGASRSRLSSVQSAKEATQSRVESKSISSSSQDKANMDAKECDMLGLSSLHHKIHKYFPHRDTNNLMAAASILRKRYAEWNFPLVPEDKTPGKYIEHDTAVKMIKGMGALPRQDVMKFLDRYNGRVEQFTHNLLKYHQQYTSAQHRLLSAQRTMFEQFSVTNSTFPLTPGYLEDLRSVVQTQLSLAIRLGKRVTEMERMLSLQTALEEYHYTGSSLNESVRNPQKSERTESLNAVQQFTVNQHSAVIQDTCTTDGAHQERRCDTSNKDCLLFTSPPVSQKKEAATTTTTATTTSLSRYSLSPASSDHSSPYVLSPLCKDFMLSKDVLLHKNDEFVSLTEDHRNSNSSVGSSGTGGLIGAYRTVLGGGSTCARGPRQRMT